MYHFQLLQKYVYDKNSDRNNILAENDIRLKLEEYLHLMSDHCLDISGSNDMPCLD